ncbi:bifunctional diguanylate cyclase/phosphodiesterase [Pulveribacter suum]|uniref:Bifunctional diguanylate cyclase/phosphodiesterase n=1 Tax=Pulveribacter suum TaxID=2116657 RepID=A0A2P1NHN0_9BURK|nr:GGDEF domain-containing protein [Pulveribacter suum]AVP56564.1 bifunctional diguanylate cyclase/phosphodiesterase [Pulveribacter suum]
MGQTQPPEPLGDTPQEPPGAAGAVDACALAVLSAATVRAAAAALARGLQEAGVAAPCVVWFEPGGPEAEPPGALTPARRQLALAAGHGDAGLPPGVHLLHAAGAQRDALVLTGAAALPDPATRLLALASQRIGELRTMQRLRQSVHQLEQAEQLQHALFAIADLAASEQNMDAMLRGLHQIVGRLMYAQNFFIALHDRQRESVRFIYFADEKDGQMYDPRHEVPVAQLKDSFTLAIIQQARTVRGPAGQVARSLGLSRGAVVGTPSADFMGVPMLRDGVVLGVLAVQSYRAGLGYSEADCAVLGFVAEHVLNAVERKRGQQVLERHVADRTRELALANQQLQQQVAERERAAHLQATLYRIAAMANSQERDADFYRSVHAAVGELINAENFYIALVSADGRALHFPYSVDAAGESGVDRPLGRGLSEYVIRQGRTQLLDVADMEGLLARGDVELQRGISKSATVCWLGAPLLGPAGVMGVVTVQSYRPDLRYDTHDADLLTFVSHQIANSVHRRQQAEALQALNAQLEQRVHERTQELRQQIAVREQMQAQLKHQVMHDPLTQLPNRVYLRDRLERALALRQRDARHEFALLYLDVDRFKLFNDSLGHLVGDGVLCEVASRLLQCVRGPDLVARLSGDEFAILIEHGAQPTAGRKVAQRIQEGMQAPVQAGERELQVSVSIGIAVCQGHHQTIDEILHDADVALYRAKAGGRQRFVLFDQSQHEGGMDVLDVAHQLRQALAAGHFEPHFQPIVRLDDGATVGYEALIRWRHPVRGLLGPGEFLPVAEQTGLIEAIDWHMYRLACLAGAPLVRGGGFLTLNVSPRHFVNADFDQALLALLAETGFAPERLHIEVTESTLLGDPQAVAAILQRLQAARVGTALDDFGTGYSSLGHVHRFPLSMIKIDRSFTHDLDRVGQPRSAAIIQAVLGLGRALDLDVVAEGVETEAQRQVLLAMGCVYGQGFYFGRPSPAAHWLAAPAR